VGFSPFTPPHAPLRFEPPRGVGVLSKYWEADSVHRRPRRCTACASCRSRTHRSLRPTLGAVGINILRCYRRCASHHRPIDRPAYKPESSRLRLFSSVPTPETSARLLERMSILLGESVGFLLGEKDKDDALYRESKENFNAWVREAGDDVDARTANEIFDQWKTDYFARKVESSPVSLRNEIRAMQKADWDDRFRLAKSKKPPANQRSMFGT
jgi:hypothetical protein